MRSLFGDCDEIRDALLASRPHPGLHNDKSSRFLERQMPKLLALNSENARKDGVDLPGGGDANCCSKSPIRFLRLMLGNDMARQNVSNLNGRHRSGVGDVGPPGCPSCHMAKVIRTWLAMSRHHMAHSITSQRIPLAR